jgi:hypothetical protein
MSRNTWANTLLWDEGEKGRLLKLHLHALPQGVVKYAIAGRVGEVSEEDSDFTVRILGSWKKTSRKKNRYATAAIATAIATAIPASACRLISQGPGSGFGWQAVVGHVHFGNETIACRRNGFDELRFATAVVQRLAKQSYAAGQRVLGDHGLRPNLIQKLLLTDQAISILQKVKEQPQQLWLQRHRRSVSEEAELPIVKPHIDQTGRSQPNLFVSFGDASVMRFWILHSQEITTSSAIHQYFCLSGPP